MKDLDVVLAAEARALWTRTVRPVARDLGFKPGKPVLRGWIREATPIRISFWFQVNRYGFDKRTGGEFVVEFTAQYPARRTSLRDRLWRLLDDLGRREAFRINNDVVASLPGPSSEVLRLLPQDLRPTYVANFKAADQLPPANSDVWFRYARTADAQRWADFVAARLPFVAAECERRLQELPENHVTMGGAVFENPKPEG